MKSYYEKLVEEQGKDAADEYMRGLRAKRKTNRGGGFNDPKVVAKAVKKRKSNVRPEIHVLPDKEIGEE